jgi:hypothetical protein
VELAPDALAETLHAVLKKANYKEIPLLLNLLPVLTMLSPRGGYFLGLAPCSTLTPWSNTSALSRA